MSCPDLSFSKPLSHPLQRQQSLAFFTQHLFTQHYNMPSTVAQIASKPMRTHTKEEEHTKTSTVPSQRVALIEKVLLLKKHRSSGIRGRSDYALYPILIYFGFHRHPTSGRNCNIHA
ncbi:hypothetical protein M422DRAFT_242919 [Sphaerobolus stellatus SS14]|nr:hypothetical protein M422DRAFT_242919 [Sphaerobolus stellatus SS14]